MNKEEDCECALRQHLDAQRAYDIRYATCRRHDCMRDSDNLLCKHCSAVWYEYIKMRQQYREKRYGVELY